MPDGRSYNEMVAFDDRGHEALMGVWWVGQLMKKHARRFFSRTLASEIQFNVMMLLKYAERPLSQQELSRKLFVDKSNLTGVAGRMVEAGLIVRDVDPTDARAYQLSLTPKGLATLAQVEMPYRDEIHRLMASFTDDELAHLTDYMVRLQTAIERTVPLPPSSLNAEEDAP